MPDTFKVSCTHCGHTLQVDNRAIGKEISCQRCGKHFVVSRPAPEMVTVTCTCGNTYSVPASKAGKRAKCNTCGAEFIIPNAVVNLSSITPIIEGDDEAILPSPEEEELVSSGKRLALILGAVAFVVVIGLVAFQMSKNSKPSAIIAQAPSPAPEQRAKPVLVAPPPVPIVSTQKPALPATQPSPVARQPIQPVKPSVQPAPASVQPAPQAPAKTNARMFVPTARVDMSTLNKIKSEPSTPSQNTDTQTPTPIDKSPEPKRVEAVVINERSNLQAINRKIASEVSPLIEAKKWDEAAALLKEIETDLHELAQQNNLPLWDTTISPIFRLIDTKRTFIQTKRSPDGPAEAKTATTRPANRLTVEQNRQLAEIRAALPQIETLTRDKKIDQAQSVLDKTQADLNKFVQAEKIPEWIIPVAVLFQTAAKRQDDIEEARSAEAAKAQALAAEANRLRTTKPPTAQTQQPTVANNGLEAGQLAPGFNALTLDGGQFATQQFKGKYVLLDFWATWCGPCRGEIPYLQDVYQTYGKDKRFVLISLSIDSQIQTPAQYAVQNQMTWIQAFLGANSQVAKMYQVRSIPSIMLIGPDGKVIAAHLRGENIKMNVAEALSASPGR